MPPTPRLSSRLVSALFVAALALAGALFASTAQATIPDPIALTENGLVRGTTTPDMFVFRGIPYAAPPVGDLRWRPPEPAARWKKIRDASAFAPHCAQPPSPFDEATLSED